MNTDSDSELHCIALTFVFYASESTIVASAGSLVLGRVRPPPTPRYGYGQVTADDLVPSG